MIDITCQNKRDVFFSFELQIHSVLNYPVIFSCQFRWTFSHFWKAIYLKFAFLSCCIWKTNCQKLQVISYYIDYQSHLPSKLLYELLCQGVNGHIFMCRRLKIKDSLGFVLAAKKYLVESFQTSGSYWFLSVWKRCFLKSSSWIHFPKQRLNRRHEICEKSFINNLSGFIVPFVGTSTNQVAENAKFFDFSQQTAAEFFCQSLNRHFLFCRRLCRSYFFNIIGRR